MSNHPILVTGATGHIGNVLVRKLLKQGKKVRAMILPGEDTTPLNNLQVEQVHADVLDCSALQKAFSGIRQVFHLAGVISIMPGKNSLIQKINVEGTANVIKAAVSASVEKLVYVSSIHALARIPHGKTIDEQVPYDPENTYGAYDQSKAQASLLVQEAARNGLNAVIACPTGVIGPYDFRNSLMGSVIRSAAFRNMTPYIDGAYDFVDVRDVADGLMAIAEKGRQGASYLLSGHRISVRYLLQTVHEITGHGFPHFKIPLSIARIAAKFTPAYYRLSKSSPRFTPYSIEVLQSNSFISHELATQELGYISRPLADSIRDAIRWYFEQPLMTAGIKAD
ncbi:MAG: NAD-dependent epimerase/dehydratase family protein [Chloroflexota bacterium]